MLQAYLRLPVFMLVAARLVGLLMFQPILGALSIPARMRTLLILGLAVLITPFVPFHADVPDTVAGLVLAMGGEALLGVLIGMVVAIVFVGVQMGGTLIAQESGLAFGQIADPTTGENMTVLSAIYVQITAVVFLVIGGHRVVLSACLDSFRSIPLLGDQGLARFGTDLLVDALTVGGAVAIRVAAPAVLTLFLVNLAMGFIARTVPQLNVVTIGFSLKGMVGFLVLAISLPSAMAAFVGALDTTFAWIHDLVGP